jgi:2-oxo-3-hexenedioate decarboxylase/2-keto-4-pentenoate hydratase
MTEADSWRRRRRVNGEESRERILDAAAEIAALRGYGGTSIDAVSKLSGLPPSSIYWHFTDKDDLIAAVVERSYGRWLAAAAAPVVATDAEYAHVMAQQVLKGLREAPDFLRLGLMLVLERRPEEPKARTMFVQVRDSARLLLRDNLRRAYPGLTDEHVQQLTDFALAAADGLFVSSEAVRDDIDMSAQFDLLAASISALAQQLSVGFRDTRKGPPLMTQIAAPDAARLTAAAAQLRQAEIHRRPVAPVTEQIPGLTPAQAYAIQQVNIDARVAAGDPVVGHKIGLTAKAMQELLCVDVPDYGHLLASMVFGDGAELGATKFCAPRVEPEIAYRLHTPLTGPGVSADDVRAATESVAPALEIVDSRVAEWRITLADTIADNASSAAVVVGDWIPIADAPALPSVAAELEINGDVVATGTGADVLGDPAEAVAWLANALGEFGVSLQPGHLILPGACTTAPFVHPGQHVTARFAGIGSVSVTFV